MGYSGNFSDGYSGNLRAIEIGAVFAEAVLFGLYSAAFFLGTTQLTKGWNKWTSATKTCGVLSTLIYLLSIAHLAIGLHRLMHGFVSFETSAESAAWFDDWTAGWEHKVHFILYGATVSVSQIFMVYRMYLTYQKRKGIIIFPIILAGACIVETGLSHRGKNLILVFPFFLVSSAWMCIFIAYKLVTKPPMSKVHPDSGRKSYNVVIESALIMVIELLLALITFAAKTNGYRVLVAMAVPTTGIAIALICNASYNDRSSIPATTTNAYQAEAEKQQDEA